MCAVDLDRGWVDINDNELQINQSINACYELASWCSLFPLTFAPQNNN